MEINVAMDKKLELEEKILDLIDRFEQKTELSVYSIDINSSRTIGSMYPKISSVKVEIRM
jgi:hypothetical protein